MLLALPVLTVVLTALQPAGDSLAASGRLRCCADYAGNSVLLMLGVGAGTLLIGVPAAWLTSMPSSPAGGCSSGRCCCRWRFPPTSSPTPTPACWISPARCRPACATGSGWTRQDYWFPEIRSLPGAVVMLALVLYPYVYLLARAAFLDQSGRVLEVSRTLGADRGGASYAVALPLARPA